MQPNYAYGTWEWVWTKHDGGQWTSMKMKMPSRRRNSTIDGVSRTCRPMCAVIRATKPHLSAEIYTINLSKVVLRCWLPKRHALMESFRITSLSSRSPGDHLEAFVLETSTQSTKEITLFTLDDLNHNKLKIHQGQWWLYIWHRINIGKNLQSHIAYIVLLFGLKTWFCALEDINLLILLLPAQHHFH